MSVVSRRTSVALCACLFASLGSAAGASAQPPPRVVELVSTVHKAIGLSAAKLSADGNQALFFGVGGGMTEGSYGWAGPVRATRTGTGWVASDPLPQSAAWVHDTVQILSGSPDFGVLQLLGRRYLSAGPPFAHARYTNATGALDLGAEVTARSVTAVVSSSDMTRAVGYVGETPFDGAIYDLLGGPDARLISLMPDGTPPMCPIATADVPSRGISSAGQNWVSSEGNRVFFRSRGDDCANPLNVYMRQGGSRGGEGTTTLISGPPVSGPDLGARFAQATADGSRIFVTSATRLAADDRNDSTDVYEHTVGMGNKCLTCVVPNAAVDPAADTVGDSIVVSQGGERVYFTSQQVLAVGGREGIANIYVWRRGEPASIGYVGASFGRLENRLVATGNSPEALTTPDGSALLFQSAHPDLDGLTGARNGGFQQTYHYDDRSGLVRCVTCPPGQASRDIGTFPIPGVFLGLDQARVMTDDGHTVVFESGEGLVPRDVNNNNDVYEWHDGEVRLITDGVSSGRNQLFEISADGRDVLFGSMNELAPGVRDRALQVYDARIGGGFPAVPEPVPCREDQCQGAPPQPPSLPVAGTVTFTGPVVDDESAPERRPLARVRLRGATVRGSRISLRVTVPARGQLSINGRRTRRDFRFVRRAGTYRLAAVLKASARRALARRGRLDVRIRVTYMPADGQPTSAAVRVKVSAS